MKLNRPAIAFAHDIVMAAVAYNMAMALRLWDELLVPDGGSAREALLPGTLMMVALAATAYWWLGLHRGVWRYASIKDLVALVKAVSVITVGFVLGMFLFNRLDTIPRSVPIIQWFVLLILLGGPRLLLRALRDHRLARAQKRALRVPVLLVGVGTGAELFIRAIQSDVRSPYQPVGILDRKAHRIGRRIHDVPVLGTPGDLEQIAAELAATGRGPQRVIITEAEGQLDGAMVRFLVETCSRMGLTLGRLPSLTDFREAISEGKITLKPIAIEDLLGRPQAVLNYEAIAGLIKDRAVLITGAGGTIGGELSRQVAALSPARLVLVESSEVNLYNIDLELRESLQSTNLERVLCDVRDRAHVFRVFEQFCPDLVFHAAALKHVPLVEENLVEGARTNVIGTCNVADAASRYQAAAMVLISTDKAVRPSSVMGATKRFAEAYIQSLDVDARRVDNEDRSINTRFMTVRFGNVLGSSGSVVPLFQRQLSRGGPLTVTHPDMRRYFMTVREAVQLVLQASAHGLNASSSERGTIFVLDMGEPVKIVDLARQMIRLAGLQPDKDVKVVFTGLRPGEKLYEELLSEDDRPLDSDVTGVFVAAPQVIELGVIRRACRELEQATLNHDVSRVLRVLATIAPDFHAARDAQAAPAQCGDPDGRAG